MVKKILDKNSFILDCSVTMAWFFEDEVSDYSERVLEHVTHSTALVPAIWPVEVANALVVAERKKRISHIHAATFKENLNLLLIQVDDTLLHKPINTIFELAKETGLTAYDSAYLELAMRKMLPIATLDRDLKKAAEKLAVELL